MYICNICSFLFNKRILILDNQQWNEEAQDVGCFRNFQKRINVQSQLECQSLCKDDSVCVGIMYSHMEGFNKYCHLCYNDLLSSMSGDFGFYRRPGGKVS